MGRVSDLLSVVGALDFQKDRGHLIRDIPAGNWPRLLALTDAAQLTLPLALRLRDSLPPDVQTRVATNLARNAARAHGTQRLYSSIDQKLRARGVEFIVLKGMTHFPSFCDDLAHRPQFDIDIFCPGPAIHHAAEAIGTLGYEPVGSGHTATADHLPSLILKTGFRWKGDYYDPELPLVIELHYQFWNAQRESFQVHGADGFWSRRTTRTVPHENGVTLVPALHPVDDLAFTTWHLVRHLLRGNLRLYHVYELAHFLHRTASDDLFWRDWQTSPDAPRTAEPIAFRLARDWFGCRLHHVVTSEIDLLPPAVDRWFRMFAFSPVTAMETPNKDELFLHLALAKGSANRFRIAARRVFPTNPPRVVMDAHVKSGAAIVRARRKLFLVRFLLGRALRHVSSWSPLVRSSLRWWRACRVA